MICAADAGKDACEKDSGGPLIDSATKEQVGVVSFGMNCGDPNYPGVYANIADQRSWITATTGI